MANLARYRKTLMAAITAGLISAQALLPLTPLEHSWISIALAVLGALGVYQVPNAPMPAKASSTSQVKVP